MNSSKVGARRIALSRDAALYVSDALGVRREMVADIAASRFGDLFYSLRVRVACRVAVRAIRDWRFHRCTEPLIDVVQAALRPFSKVREAEEMAESLQKREDIRQALEEAIGAARAGREVRIAVWADGGLYVTWQEAA
jgi:hypothetical protein